MKNLLYIGNRLARHGFNLTSIETLGPLLEREGFRVRYASAKKNKVFRMVEMLWKTIRYSRDTNYVLIDTYSTYNFWYAVIISQLCRILNLKYIPKLHGGELPRRLQHDPWLCGMIFNHSYVNIAPSGYLHSAFKQAGFVNTIYIPNTIELKNYTVKQRNRLSAKLLWVRSFSPIYNPEMALHVLEKLKNEFRGAELCMVGPDKNGNLEKTRQLAIELGLDVTFTGKLSKEEWTKLSENYDIFINTTHFDNTPVSVIEAMALGLPVVSTNVGGLPYLLTHRETALLVDDNDAEAMAESIRVLLKDNVLRETLVNNSLDLVRQFDSEKIIFKWFEILK
ncbi:MAG TPA: glycosyltransferase family 4 protein [Flavobacterium sp.]